MVMIRLLSKNSPSIRTAYSTIYTRHVHISKSIAFPRQLNATAQVPKTPLPVSSQWPAQHGFPHVRYMGPVLYGITLCAGTFMVAGTVFDRNQQTLWDRIRAHSRQWSLFGISDESLLTELWKEKRDMIIERRRAILENLARRLDNMHLPTDIKRALWMVGEKLTSMSEAEKTLAGLIAINTVVFGLWKVPRLTSLMSQWFLHLPGSKKNITLLTSCFSHQEFFHFTLNMVGLWSFGKVVHDALGREQFIAMYLGAGVGANVISHVCSLALRRSRPLLPSLGASGAIYSLVAATAIMYPNSSISLIFLPMIPIQLGFALPALMAFDAAGILFKWRMFDHFAHLAGASLGIGYLTYGEQYIWTPLIRKIHESRSRREGNGSGRNNGTFMWTEARQPEQRNTWSGWFNKS